MLVKVYKDWKSEHTFDRQAKGESFFWDGIEFTLDESAENYDYLIVLNRPAKGIEVKNCSKSNCWLISMEPPTVAHRWYKKSFEYFGKVITQFEDISHPGVIYSHGALPWHIGKSYKELMDLSSNRSNKIDKMSCISSNLNWMKGHELRLLFIQFLKDKDYDFDLFGRGVNPIDDKFDGLYPYKYSLAIENTSVDHYWTEKISDCFLSWTMPIYYGATNITKYFPENSFIWINPEKPEEALSIIKDAIQNNAWEKNIDAIKEARELVLNKYQFLPFVADMIKKEKEVNTSSSSQLDNFSIPSNIAPWEGGPVSFARKIEYRIRKAFNRKPY